MKSPSAPNPYDTASAQQNAELGASQSSSIINNPNVVTPYGTQSYSIAGYETIYDANGNAQYVPRYTQTQTLSPDQQKLLGLQTQMGWNMGQTGVEQSAKLRDLLGKSVDTSGLTGWQQGPQAAKLATSFGGQGDIRQDQGPTDRRAIESAMLGRWTSDAAKQNAAQEAQLAARGMNVGSSQYGSVREQQDRARTDAQQQAYLASGEESRAAQAAYNQAQQQRYQEALGRAGFSNEALAQMFNMGGQASDRTNALRQQQLAEILALRNQPLNEISALMAGSQVTVPQFNPFSAQGINSANLAGLIGQNYAQQSANTNAFNSGLFNLASAGLGGWLGA